MLGSNPARVRKLRGRRGFYETVKQNNNKGYPGTGTSDIPQCGYGVMVAHNLAKVVVRVQIPLFTLDGTSHSDTNVGISRGDGSPVKYRGVRISKPKSFESVGAWRKTSQSRPCGVTANTFAVQAKDKGSTPFTGSGM